MPSRWMSGHTGGPFVSASNPPSAPSSRASSRASSPTRNGPSSRPSHIMLPSRRQHTTDSGDFGDYFSGNGASPAYENAPRTPAGWGGLSTPLQTPGVMTPGGTHSHSSVTIYLDSDQLVMRGQGGDMNPAYLSGRLELDLVEPTNIKEITMTMTGKAKVQFADGAGTSTKSRHFSHPVATHNWSFLQGDKGHAHTLKKGAHTFPFSFMLDGNLPSSLRTYSGDAVIGYKLRAVAVRSGFASNFSTMKEFNLARMYTPEALEFNQTLEIENTWPGKVMYSLTLPYKAYAAGDDIPVNVKFMPLAKGVRVTTVVSVLKEYTLVHTRHSSHPDTRVDSCVKHEIRDGRAVEIAREPVRPPQHWIESQGSAASANRSANQSRHSSPSQTPVVGSRARLAPSRAGRSGQEGGYFPSAQPSPEPSTTGASTPNAPAAGPSNAVAGSSTSVHSEETRSEEDIEIGDEEINTFFSIPIPEWVTPSHAIHPVFVTHKIKWSCSISNPDGHVSELRCALPIIILDHSLLEEARAAGASTRGLLFGNGPTDEPQVDLPSYSNHVYDRIAFADSGNASGFVPRSVAHTPAGSPDDTPPRSRAPSRPGSPTRGLSYGTQSSRSGDHTPATDVPPRRQLSNFVDSELLASLGALRTHSNGTSPASTPPDSAAPSRPLSRRNSRSGLSSRVGSRMGSRAGSRASSPERGERNSNPSSTSGSYAEESHLRPSSERRSTGLHGLFHLPMKPMRPLSHLGGSHNRPILRNNASNLTLPSENIPRNSSVPGNIGAHGSTSPSLPSGAQSSASSQNHVSFAPHATTFEPERSGGTRFQIGGPETPSEIDEEDVDPLSQVPSYDIASRGFLGGGVVPLDVRLPTYDASERSMERTRSGTDLAESSSGSGGLVRPRSDTALVQLGAQAAADAEGRAQAEAELEEAEGLRVAPVQVQVQGTGGGSPQVEVQGAGI
ncbi:hypothetical protein IAT38_007630 [Cryptococcus sp. DSM 104549]